MIVDGVEYTLQSIESPMFSRDIRKHYTVCVAGSTIGKVFGFKTDWNFSSDYVPALRGDVFTSRNKAVSALLLRVARHVRDLDTALTPLLEIYS